MTTKSAVSLNLSNAFIAGRRKIIKQGMRKMMTTGKLSSKDLANENIAKADSMKRSVNAQQKSAALSKMSGKSKSVSEKTTKANFSKMEAKREQNHKAVIADLIRREGKGGIVDIVIK